jgi:3-dehydroquinate synthase
MKKIEVKIPGKEYPIFLGEGIINRLVQFIKLYKLNQNIFIVVDRNILRSHAARVEDIIKRLNCKKFMHVYDASEANKSFFGAEKIYLDLINLGFTRDTLVIAIGGGITGDITGFVASTFMRGVKFIQVPTTLLSAVDSSVGGKTGFNFEETKNIVGTFYQPEFVLVDTAFLKTLPEDELICGTGEILKYAFLIDEEMFDSLHRDITKLITLNAGFVSKIIEKCVRFKGDVVAKDEKESGLRKILNLGHTFAHAFEVEQNYLLKHGQAVTVGIVCALELSLELGLINQNKYERFKSLPLLLKDKIEIKHCDINLVYETMKRDKKGSEDKIKFVLPADLGRLVVDVTAPEEKVKLAVQKGISNFIKQI